MLKQIVINSTPQEARVALLEGPRLLEIFIERARSRGIGGNIYKGRVTRVLPGMQAAFVDIGIEKAAFLHVSDSYPNPATLAVEEDSEDAPPPNGDSENGEPLRRPPIEEILKKGDELVVQVAKEPIGSKGARITTQISLPGRYLVYIPTTTHLGVSRRIDDERERERLREIAASVQPPDSGLIVRTSCEGVTKREVVADLRFLTRLWSRISKKAESVSAPTLLHYDMDLILRVIRDLFTNDVRACSRRQPARLPAHRLLHRDGHAPARRRTSCCTKGPSRSSSASASRPRSRVPSSARCGSSRGATSSSTTPRHLTAIDVNTGRYVGKSNQEETVLRTNLEAAKTIVEQLRLRNIGGLIIIDFIDMEEPATGRRCSRPSATALKKDKARTNLLRMSELGLVEMTRKRTRESLPQLLCAPCPHCDGTRPRQRCPHRRLRRSCADSPRGPARNPDLERHHGKSHLRAVASSSPPEAARRGLGGLERETGKRSPIKACPDLARARPFEVIGAEPAHETRDGAPAPQAPPPCPRNHLLIKSPYPSSMQKQVYPDAIRWPAA